MTMTSRFLLWWYRPPSWKEVAGWFAPLAAFAVGYRLFRRWVDSDKPKEEALAIHQKVWNAIDAVICLIAAPMVLRTGFHGVVFMVQALRFWASYARSLIFGVSLLAETFGDKDDVKVKFVRAAEKAADDIVERTASDELVEKQRKLLNMSEAEFTTYQASQKKDITELFDQVDAKAAESGMQIEAEAKQGRRYNRWVIVLIVLIVILIAVTAYLYFHKEEEKKEEVKKEETKKGKNKKNKREMRNRYYEYDSDGNRVYRTDDDDYAGDMPDPYASGYSRGEEGKKPVCPVWQHNRGKCKPDGSICDEFYHPKEWKQPCENRGCPGTAKCGRPHIARRRPQQRKKEEAQLAEPIVPLTKALVSLAWVECFSDGELHKGTNGLLIFGRLWIPYHLWRDAKGKVTFRIVWTDKTEDVSMTPPVKVGNLDLGYLSYVPPQGRKSITAAEPIVGEKATTLAFVDGETSTSTGYVTAITEFSADHSVSTNDGHCFCAFLNKHGKVMGLHVQGSSKTGTMIPLTPSVVRLMMSKNL